MSSSDPAVPFITPTSPILRPSDDGTWKDGSLDAPQGPLSSAGTPRNPLSGPSTRLHLDLVAGMAVLFNVAKQAELILGDSVLREPADFDAAMRGGWKS